MPKSEKTAEQCIEEEKRDIRRRRMVHQSSSAGDSLVKGATHEVDRFTGLALSGGGVRSAAFSLGFLQAMYSAGRMKAFDYLSTVSGGGYAGGLFSSVVARETNKINWDRKGTHNRLEFESLPDGGQPDSVERLSLHGRLMGNFLRLFSRHLWGFLVNVSFVASGIFAIAALLAYIMRTPWSPSMAPTLAELKFNSDLTVPFFYTFVLLALWVLSQFVSRIASLVKAEIAPIGLFSYVLLLASVLLGILTMLAIGDIDLGALIAGKNGSDQLVAVVNQVVRWVGIGMSTIFVTFLLPYLTPKRLLQSGDPGAGPIQSLIFRLAGNGLIVGAPLFIFFFLVHEDISGFNSNRDNADQLTPSHLGSPLEFAAYLESQVNIKIEPHQELARRIYATLTDNDKKEWNGTKEEKEDWNRIGWRSVELPQELKQMQKNYDVTRIDNEKFGFGSRCLQWLADTIRIDDQFSKRLAIAENIRLAQLDVVERFNTRILSDPSLFDFPGKIRNTTSVEDVSTQPDQLLKSLGLPVGAPKPSSDDQLSHALDSIRTSKNQLTTRFWGLKISLPNEDAPQKTYASDDHFTFAHVQLASGNEDRSQVEEVSIEPNLDGEFISKLDKLIKDKDGSLQQEIKNVLEEYGVSSDASVAGSFEERFKEWKAKQALIVGDLSRTIRESNWLLLEKIYPKYIRPQATIFARVVNDADQMYRLRIAGYAVVIFLVVGLFSNLNTSSLHGVYRDQLAEIWLPDPDIRLDELDTCSRGAPYHIINGTVNRMGHRNDPDVEGRSRFIFSHRFCGTKKIGYRETKDYENGSIGVADAIAISGGAVTSVNAPSSIQQLILFLTNFRLGQWVSSPVTYSKDYYWPSPIRTITNLMWLPEQRKFLFISDGGHNDNTGLATLFERKCRLIVCVDASQDSDYEFRDFLKVLHAARSKYGVRVEPLDSSVALADALDSLRPGACDRSKAHFVTFKVHYPGQAEPAAFVYCKLTVTGDEALDLVERTRAKGSFPHDPTSDQFLLPNIFESYLELGRHIGEQVDKFVCEGGLDSFSIGQGWCGDDPTPTESGKAKVENATVSTDNTQVAIGVLDDAKFDDEGVDQANKILETYASNQLSRVHDPAHALDTAELEIVSSWSRDRGIDASRALRRKFCRVVINQVNQFATEIKANPVIRLHYCIMLEALGDSIPDARQTLKKLSISDTVA